MCNVGKSWSKQVLVLFRLAQSVALYVKLELSGYRSISDFWPNSINRISGKMLFFVDFQLNPNSFKMFRVLCFFPRYIRKTLATF